MSGAKVQLRKPRVYRSKKRNKLQRKRLIAYQWLSRINATTTTRILFADISREYTKGTHGETKLLTFTKRDQNLNVHISTPATRSPTLKNTGVVSPRGLKKMLAG